MAIEVSIKKGDQLTESEEYDKALEAYSAALKENPSAFKALLGKGIVHQRLKQYDLAITEITKALQVAKDRAKSQDIGLCHLRLAITYFHNKDIAKSLQEIQLAKKIGSTDPALPIWFSKITKKAEKNGITAGAETAKPDISVPASVPTAAATPVSSTPQQAPKMSFYQSNEKITIDFFYKKAENPNIQFQPTTLSVEFKTATGSDVIFDYKLFAPIIPEECSFKVMSTKVEVTLKKKQSGKWSSLEGSGKDLTTTSAYNNNTTSSESSQSLAYPSSSKNKVDWSKVNIDEDNDNGQGDGDNNADGDDGDDENAFFRKLYANADDDTKRAMMKSFVESNGTALSTNWSETKEKQWEVSPPEHTEAKKW